MNGQERTEYFQSFSHSQTNSRTGWNANSSSPCTVHCPLLSTVHSLDLPLASRQQHTVDIMGSDSTQLNPCPAHTTAAPTAKLKKSHLAKNKDRPLTHDCAALFFQYPSFLRVQRALSDLHSIHQDSLSASGPYSTGEQGHCCLPESRHEQGKSHNVILPSTERIRSP